jgi:hypothetical protein
MYYHASVSLPPWGGPPGPLPTPPSATALVAAMPLCGAGALLCFAFACQRIFRVAVFPARAAIASLQLERFQFVSRSKLQACCRGAVSHANPGAHPKNDLGR